ncbi:uncharacterized protein L969DRAFT_18205 [Mixia osmundae IAM 14324]|uniref:AB hydrolase-1 domain-containing protein n=1 Tax=Mixia osmundae (strain CBS 9802 / IAM 14324 / JCM 22182 / KY 12970) TaxID=764103 RepID=G7E6M4_MIXOS|nr:uncharacterized protein L969DRAFT_18205 [Mixia osmundae IAM 14324]KEI39138.1 hypothetical protein L969DRAFT_18205 [Mixia osmundae IAM 14324]GAA98484.1 hypothetical protein E5Q_05170 [Mixia osmundae IAM 14324]
MAQAKLTDFYPSSSSNGGGSVKSARTTEDIRIPADTDRAMTVSAFPHPRSHSPHASEQTPLLAGSTPTPPPPLTAGAGFEPPKTRPYLLRLSFLFSAVITWASLAFLVLICLAITHSQFVYLLPSHRGSLFLPLWLSIFSFLSGLLSMIYYSDPLDFPAGPAKLFSLLSAILILVDVVLVGVNRQLRLEEGWLTLILLIINFVSYVHSLAATSVLPQEDAPDLPIYQRQQALAEQVGFFARAGENLKSFFSLLTITLPVFVLQLATTVALALIMLDLILRAYDSTVVHQQSTDLYKINPSSFSVNSPSTLRHHDRSDDKGIFPGDFRLHLDCRFLGTPVREPRYIKTVLFDSDKGIPASVESSWAVDAMEHLDGNGTAYRLCIYDRPGYGLSDVAPSAELAMTVRSLESALVQAGVMAEIQSAVPLGSSFVLVGAGYGALVSRVFAARNPSVVESILYLDASTELTHFSPDAQTLARTWRFFFSNILGAVVSPLGIKRWLQIIFLPGRASREGRIFGTVTSGLNAPILRAALQESAEAHRHTSRSYLELKRSRKTYPDVPAIVLTSKEKLQSKAGSAWEQSQEWLVKIIIGDSLVRWDEIKAGGSRLLSGPVGRDSAGKALKQLLARSSDN